MYVYIFKFPFPWHEQLAIIEGWNEELKHLREDINSETIDSFINCTIVHWDELTISINRSSNGGASSWVYIMKHLMNTGNVYLKNT